MVGWKKTRVRRRRTDRKRIRRERGWSPNWSKAVVIVAAVSVFRTREFIKR